ncbi:hypothetical protein B0H13DRAFT_2315121 [Mycena leptocephala]|nr:hypothetical protein B0H13DRAFT_2315121 [Mycena leptocephala]
MDSALVTGYDVPAADPQAHIHFCASVYDPYIYNSTLERVQMADAGSRFCGGAASLASDRRSRVATRDVPHIPNGRQGWRYNEDLEDFVGDTLKFVWKTLHLLNRFLRVRLAHKMHELAVLPHGDLNL